MSAANRPDSEQMGRRRFLTLACAGSSGLVAAGAFAAEKLTNPNRPPNVIVILADDLGYGDVSCYGRSAAPTPNIDSIADNGVRFTSGYATAPQCSPSRAGLLTGRYQQRFGNEFNAGGPARCRAEGLGLAVSETTIADVLTNVGYATGLVGKWHLGTQTKFLPTNRGFDEFFGFLYGLSLYAEPADRAGVHASGAIEKNRGGPQLRHEFQTIYRDTEPVKEPVYLTDAFTREAVHFIERHSNSPFFLCVPYSAVHKPLQVTDKYYKRFAHIRDDRLRIYAAMVSAMDDGVGAILRILKEKGIEENTLLFFVSDNGAEQGTGSNKPLNTGKFHLFEGGIRVPFVAQWPGRLPAGKTCSEPVSTLDIMPTAAAAAGAPLPDNRPLDGVNLLPYLTAETSAPPHDTLFWRVGPNAAARKGRWKYVELDRERSFLFDLETDIGEMRNLADDKPRMVAAMAEALKDWETQMVEPLWSSRGNLTVNLSDYALGEGTYKLFI